MFNNSGESEWMGDLLYLEVAEGNLLENGQIVDDQITAHRSEEK